MNRRLTTHRPRRSPTSVTPLVAVAVVAITAALALAGCEGQLVDPGFRGADAGAKTPDAPEPTGPPIPTPADCADEEQIFAGQAPVRLLTRYEYDNTARDLLGVDLGLARGEFPPENAVDGFENNADSHRANPLLVSEYLHAAETLAEQALAEHRDTLVGCEPSAACREDFLARFVERAMRRPPTADELDRYRGLFETAEQAWGFEEAVELTVVAVLQSPQFLYRIEFADQHSPGALVEVGPYQMASRLSYFLWATMPDEALLQAARDGELDTVEGVQAQVERMVASPKARGVVRHFYRQWLQLDALDSLVKDTTAFPSYTDAMPGAWRESLLRFVTHVHFEAGGQLDGLLTSPTVFLSDAMAPVYDAAPQGVEGMAAHDLGDQQRAGLLTQPGLLALLAYPNQGSPIHRGIFVREKVLCQALAPPPDANLEPPDPDPDATTREQFAEHTANAACASCHRLIDPIGFGFERYDGIGAYRETEAGRPVDASGALTATDDPSIQGPFDGALELAERLAGAREVQDCIASQWFTFAMGGPAGRADLCSIDRVRERFDASDGSFSALIAAIATSDAFRYRTIQMPTDEGGDR